MGLEGSLNRVMLMERGALARRSVAAWRGLGAETVLAFGTEDAEADWVDEADYAVYHGGSVGRAEPARLVAAAMDAGCDALDPGSLADEIDLLDLALRANLAVVGCDPHQAAHYRDPDWVIELAGRHGLPAAPIGPWPESDSLRRRLEVWVWMDRKQGRIVLPPLDTTLGPGPDDPWLIEHGDLPGPAAKQAILDASRDLAAEVGGAGLLRVLWGWLDETTWALRGLSSAVGSGWPLIEAVHDFDPILARVNCWMSGGGNLERLQAGRQGVLARITARGRGTLRALDLPEGGLADAAPGSELAEGELLAQVVATAPTRHAALVRLGAALEAVRVEGPPTGLEALRALCGDRELWDGRIDARQAAERLGG